MKLLIASFLLSLSLTLAAQQPANVTPQTGKIAPAGQVDLSDTSKPDFDPVITNIKEQPNPANDLKNKKAILHQQRLQSKGNGVKKNAARGANPEPPIYVSGFNANLAQGTPNDNHVAIGNNGLVVSVVNTNIRFYDTLGTQKGSTRSLQNFSSSLGTFTQNSDPRVLYDPIEDRFIILFFTGNTSTTNKIIVGFSETNDPVGQWNLYQLPGNYLKDTTWSDYPIVSITNSDLFMTFNQLKDGEDWKTGFRYSIIWQINKAKGYAGDSLAFNYWSKPSHNGQPIWSISTVMESNDFTSNESYFLSVRPSDLNNDTVFLHTITNSQASGVAQLNTKVLKTNTPYGVAPNAIQPDGQQLATNDARVLHAIIHSNRIYYAQNCIVQGANTAGVYLGRIDNPTSATPTVSGKVIGYDTIDLGYPSISHIGKGSADYRSFFTCSFVTENQFPGTAAFYIDNDGDVSDMLIVRKGDNDLNILGDSIERWGDYTGIQRRYNEDFTAWLSGSYGRSNKSYGTWVAKITTEDSLLISSVKENAQMNAPTALYPNPASDRFQVEFESEKGNHTSIQLFDMQGKLVTTLLEDKLKPGTNGFSFSPHSLTKGIYLLRITENGKPREAKQVIVN